MLDIIDNKNMLSNLMINHLGKNLITNCYLSIKEFEDEIELKTLMYREFPTGNLYILKYREDFMILYYYINRADSVKNEFNEIKSIFDNKKIVVEIPYREELQLEEVLDLFDELGFSLSLKRINLEHQIEARLDTTCPYSEIEWKYFFDSIEDSTRIREFLLDNFDKYTGCIPLKETIMKKIESNYFYVLENVESKEIVGVLEFDLGRTTTIKHLAVSKEYRGKGLGRLLINMMLNTNKNVNVWTTFSSDAEQFYKNNGFVTTEYKSAVLIYEGE